MSTGDLRNNLRKLQGILKTVGFAGEPDLDSLTKGIPTAFLPLYHHVFLNYSQPISQEISDLGIELYGKTDLRFIEGMYKVLRELFSYKPPITKDQFFSNGFAERKIIMCTEILSQASQRHKQLAPKQFKAKSVASICSTSRSTSRLGPRPASAPAQPKTKNNQTSALPPGQKIQMARAANQDLQASDTAPGAPNIINEVRHPTQTSKPARITATSRHRPQYEPSAYGHSTHVTVRTEEPVRDIDDEIGLSQMEGVHRMSATPGTLLAIHEANGFKVSQGSSQVEVVTVHKGSSDGNSTEQNNHLRPIDVVALTPCRPTVQSSQRPGSTGHSQRDLAAVATSTAHFRAMDQTIRELNARMVQMEEAMTSKDKKLETALAKVTLLENRVSLLESKLLQVTTSKARGQTISPERVPDAGTGTRLIQGTTQMLSGKGTMLSNNHSQTELLDTDFTLAAGPVFTMRQAQEIQSALEKEEILPPSPIPQNQSRKLVTDVVNSSTSPAVEPASDTNDQSAANGEEACASTPTEPQFGMTEALEKHFQKSVIKDQKTRICRMLQETEDLLHIEVASPAK